MSIPMIVSNRKTKLPPNMSDKNNMTRGYINNIGPYIDDLKLPFISTSKDGFSIKIKVYRKTILQGWVNHKSRMVPNWIMGMDIPVPLFFCTKGILSKCRHVDSLQNIMSTAI